MSEQKATIYRCKNCGQISTDSGKLIDHITYNHKGPLNDMIMNQLVETAFIQWPFKDST